MLKATVVKTEDRGIGIDGYGTINGNPDRRNIWIEPINCTKIEFVSKMIESNGEDSFCISNLKEGKFTDIGGFIPTIKVDDIICIINNHIIIDPSPLT